MTQATSTDAHRIEPAHDAHDEAKLDALIASMSQDGWIGAPVVIIEREDADPQAVTGSHRIAAAREAGIDVPTVNLAELLAEHGHNLAELLAEYESGGCDADDAAWQVAIRLNEYLPAEIIEYCGLDAH